MNDLDERYLDQYIALINKKIDASGDKNWNCLNDAERTTIMAYIFALEVTNGGFEQFFLNYGDRWHETLSAIKVVEASKLATLFEEALTIFPSKMPSADPSTRRQQLARASEMGGELLWRLTGEYYDLQAKSSEHCLYQRLTAFAIKQLAKEKP